MKLNAAVGNKAPNHVADVRTVQTLINRHMKSLTPLLPIKVDGACGPITIGMISEFQKRVVGFKRPDGRVDPGGKTFRALMSQSKAPEEGSKKSETLGPLLDAQIHRSTKNGEQASEPQVEKPGKTLSETDYRKAAIVLGVELATIKAVASVESRGNGFLSNGKPKVLFEGHWFSRFTKGKFDAKHPTLSYKKWTKRHYKGGTAEYSRYLTAYALDAVAAMKSTSWGRFQIMGFNHDKCGYGNVKDYVEDMYKSELYHLLAFVKFLKHTGLDKHLKAKNWAAFARGYNGPGYAKNKYDILMKQAYEAFSSGD